MRPRLLYLASMIIVLNLVDAIFTIFYTRLGVATESNPLMETVLDASPVVFMAAKLGLVSLGVLLLWRLRARRTAVFGLVASSAAYGMLFVYHLSAVEHLASFQIVATR